MGKCCVLCLLSINYFSSCCTTSKLIKFSFEWQLEHLLVIFWIDVTLFWGILPELYDWFVSCTLAFFNLQCLDVQSSTWNSQFSRFNFSTFEPQKDTLWTICYNTSKVWANKINPCTIKLVLKIALDLVQISTCLRFVVILAFLFHSFYLMLSCDVIARSKATFNDDYHDQINSIFCEAWCY